MVNDSDQSQMHERREAIDNRRAAFRLAIAVDLTAEVPAGTAGSEEWKQRRDGPFLRSVTEDLSVRGLRFRAPARLERDTPVEFALEVDGARMLLDGVVAHAQVDQFGAGIGVMFTNIEGHAEQSRISQFLFARERRRLPQVSVMYSVRCTADGHHAVVEGTTEECSPGFAWLLLTEPTEPGSRVLVNVRVDAHELAMRGRAVRSIKLSDLWRTGIEFDDILPIWRDVVIERKEGRR
jgi:PilZ domain